MLWVAVSRNQPPTQIDSFKCFSDISNGMPELSPSGSKWYALTDAYLPPDLIGRSEELAQLRRCLVPLARRKPAGNVWLHGPPGSGKTSAAKLLLDEFEQRYGIQGVYVNCWESGTFYAVLDRAVRDLRVLGAERLSTIFKLERLEKALGGRPLLLVLDEFDRPPPRERDAVIYNLCALPNVALICICGSRQYYHSLDSRVKSRLDAFLVEFEPYPTEQLKDIVRRRAEAVLEPGALDEGTVAKIAKDASGDARRALQMLRHAIVAAEAAGAKCVLPQHVRAGHTPTQQEQNQFLAAKLGEHCGLIYRIIHEQGELLSGGLWQEYRRRCCRARLRPAAARTFSLYLRRLIDSGLVVQRRVLGVKGNIRALRVRDGTG
jgi:Cdc6-like AAA superfamily ATPase